MIANWLSRGRQVRTRLNRNLSQLAGNSSDTSPLLNQGSPDLQPYVPPVKLGPFLTKYGSNLTKLAADGKLDPVVGRKDEIFRTLQVLSRRTKNNPCLIGEPGVGKVSFIEID